MPSDFEVGPDGSARLSSPYINNVHPDDYAELNSVIAQVLTKAIPMFEWVLSDLAREEALPMRLDGGAPSCVWPQVDVSCCLKTSQPLTYCLFPSNRDQTRGRNLKSMLNSRPITKRGMINKKRTGRKEKSTMMGGWTLYESRSICEI
jgi:hypothetical protein